MIPAPFLINIKEFHGAVLGYVVEEKLSSVFIKIEIALIISREAVTKGHIIMLMPAELCEVRWTFEELV
jgi:hypothetical protein